ncbi:MAG: periplasmic heavy metal sensor [Brevundimonas sp.]|nr:MAG: periplasmic heavy metal sensor [Brevundimonas sp.]
MSPRALKIALAVSIALNLFGGAALVTTLVARAQVEKRVDAEHRPGRDRPAMAIVRQLDPPVRGRVREALRASALAARPDFEEARAKRREAVALARAGTYDQARVTVLLTESRAAEMRGRARLEADAAQLLSTLEPADRVALSQILTKQGRAGARGDAKRDQAPRPPA